VVEAAFQRAGEAPLLPGQFLRVTRHTGQTHAGVQAFQPLRSVLFARDARQPCVQAEAVDVGAALFVVLCVGGAALDGGMFPSGNATGQERETAEVRLCRADAATGFECGQAERLPLPPAVRGDGATGHAAATAKARCPKWVIGGGAGRVVVAAGGQAWVGAPRARSLALGLRAAAPLHTAGDQGCPAHAVRRSAPPRERFACVCACVCVHLASPRAPRAAPSAESVGLRPSSPAPGSS
jgi:hypothetical protein